MTIQERLYTAQDLAAMPDDGRLHELVNGVIIEVSRPKLMHGVIAVRFSHFIAGFVIDNDLGLVTSENGYVLARNPDTVRGPDVAFISKQRLPVPDFDDYVPMAPDLAIEVVSPNDTAREIATKVQEYLHAGTRLVWVVYPEDQLVYVHEPDGKAQVIDINKSLDGGDVLPGFTLSLRDVFKGLED